MTPPRNGWVMRSWPSRRIMPARLSIRARGERVLRLVSFRGALACRHRHDARAQDADRVAAHRGADFVIGEAGVDQRLRHLHEVRGVEAHGGGAVVVAAERDMVDADEVADMLHRPGDARGRGSADRAGPIADADAPPVAATPRISASLRLRLPRQVAWTPPWLETTGRCALASTAAPPAWLGGAGERVVGPEGGQ